jgi:pimeloyl-ACP methyl ester carboxylesterase
MSNTINFLADKLTFKIPIYLIQGEEDLLTPKELTSDYFKKIKAPTKEYYLLPNTAHGFNQSVLETQYRICKKIKLQ